MNNITWRTALTFSCMVLLAACSPTQQQPAIPASAANPSAVDETAYKNEFSANFNQSCYQGFTRGFDQQASGPSDVDLQAAQLVCECISYNLTENNNAAQLEQFSKKSDVEVLAMTKPLVESCSEQIRQRLNASSTEQRAASAS